MVLENTMLTGFTGKIKLGEKVLCKEIIAKVLRKYPEIGEKEIDVRIETEQNPERVWFETTKGIGFLRKYGYSILGTIPQRAIYEGYSDLLIEAGIAHEFAHIVNGDLDGLKAKITTLLEQMRWTRNFILKRKERKADKEAIRRGFEKEIYTTCCYMERIGANRPSVYMNSRQLEKLL